MTESHPHAEDVVPLLRGVSHAWAFWLALTGALALLVLAPDSRARFAAAVYGLGSAPSSGEVRCITAGLVTRAGARCCGG